MTAPAVPIPRARPQPLQLAQARNGPAASFGPELAVEQADTLLRQTDQYARWTQLRQNDDTKALQIAELVLARDALTTLHHQGNPLDWQHFDQLTEELRQLGIILATATERHGPQSSVAAATAAAPATFEAPTGPPPLPVVSGDPLVIEDENLLILDLVCKEVGLNSMIIGYGDERTTQLPLGEVARALDFSIEVDGESGRASGWFMAEDRTLSIDATRRTVTINGTSYPWDDTLITTNEDDIYVDSRLLTQWFPIDFDINLNESAVTLTPREKLPLQLQYEREQRRLRLLQSQQDQSLRYPVMETPYEWVSFPVADIDIRSNTRSRAGEVDIQLRHAMVAEGDLGRMGARLFLSGTDDNLLRNARITLDRTDSQGQLLGPLRATSVSVGDISPAALPILGRSGAERGAMVSNAPPYRSRDYDATQFEGNVLPGWDVELYRNGNLVDSIRAGSDGRYLFEDVSVYYGLNDFKIQAHGPQGQSRILEEKAINVGSKMLSPGTFEYNVSASERKESVFGLNSGGGDGSGRFNAAFDYGLTDFLSLSAGTSSVEINGVRHNYLQGGLSGTFAGFYSQADYITDSEGGSGMSFQGQTALGPFNLRGKQEIFSDFITENSPNRRLQTLNSLSLNGTIPELAYLPSLSYTLTRDEYNYTDSTNERYSGRLSGRVLGTYLTNVVTLNSLEASGNITRDVKGTFQASGALRRGRISAGVDYDLGDQTGINQYKMSGYWPINQDLSAGISLRHDTKGQGTTSGSISMSWDMGKFLLSPSLDVDSEGNFGALVGLSFSLARDPANRKLEVSSDRRTGKGASTVFVYHDVNNNQVFDEGDTPISDAKVLAPQARKAVWTGGNGVAGFTGLTAYHPTDVEIDVDTLEDPFWQPTVSGAAVMPRPGGVHRLEFPVVTTGEIDGTVYLRQNDGTRRALANVRLEIIDSKGEVVQTTSSEHDGFYLFEKVFPGRYTLRVSSEDPGTLSHGIGVEQEIFIGTDGTIASGKDLILQPIDEQNDGDKRIGAISSATGSQQDPGTTPIAASSSSDPPAFAVTQPATSITIQPMTVETKGTTTNREEHEATDLDSMVAASTSNTSTTLQPLTFAPDLNSIRPASLAGGENRQATVTTLHANNRTVRQEQVEIDLAANHTSSSLHFQPLNVVAGSMKTTELTTSVATTPDPLKRDNEVSRKSEPETALANNIAQTLEPSDRREDHHQDRRAEIVPISHPVIQAFVPIETRLEPIRPIRSGYGSTAISRSRGNEGRTINAAAVARAYAAMQRRS